MANTINTDSKKLGDALRDCLEGRNRVGVDLTIRVWGSCTWTGVTKVIDGALHNSLPDAGKGYKWRGVSYDIKLADDKGYFDEEDPGTKVTTERTFSVHVVAVREKEEV